MYKIISTETGELLGEVSKPTYITLAKNGYFVPADIDHARGIAFHSTVYGVVGLKKRPLYNHPTVVLYEVDDGDVSMEKQEQINQLQNDLADTDETAIELFESNLQQEEVNAAQDDALIEIYELLEVN